MAAEGGVDPELKEFMEVEAMRQQFSAQVHKLTDLCWERCIDKPRDKLDYKTETCITNCTERFLDASMLITGRFQQMLQKSVGH